MHHSINMCTYMHITIHIHKGASTFSSLLATAVGSPKGKDQVKVAKSAVKKAEVDSDAEVRSDDEEDYTESRRMKASKYPSATSVYAAHDPSQDSEGDPLSQEVEEDGSDGDGEGSGDGSDEDGVITMLLEELVTMSKNRALRKRTRLMSNAVDAATSQVESYLKNWTDFNFTYCTEMHEQMAAKLEALCTTADGMCNSMTKDVQKFDAESREIVAQVGLVEQELEALQQEVVSATALQKDDEATLKTQMQARKKGAVEIAKKSLKEARAKKSSNKSSSSKDSTNNNKLMLALREL